MSRSMKIAAGILGLLVIYFVASSIFRDGDASQNRIPVAKPDTVPTLDKPVPEKRADKNGSRVMVRASRAEDRPVFLSLKGRTEAARTVIVRSETTGVVVKTEAEEGQAVEEGAVLCGLEVESRQARVSEASAAVASAKLDYDATKELVEKGWKPPNQEAAAKAVLDQANAALKSARIELSKTEIKAPFEGVFERRTAEIGDFLAPGGECGTVLDLDPLIVVVDASEKYAERLTAGSPAKALVGRSSVKEAEGNVRYVASSSDPVTRTYRVEIALDNADRAMPAGMSAEVRIQVGQGIAHHITPALIVYGDDGVPGVRYVGVGGVVELAAVEIVDSDQDGVWVTGLPAEAHIIVEGQDYIREGLRVESVMEGEAS